MEKRARVESTMIANAVSTTSKVLDAAMALIKFLKGPAAIRVISSQGMELG